MPWWLPYLLVLAVAVPMWRFVIRPWLDHRPRKPLDEKRLAELRASAYARQRRWNFKGGAYEISFVSDHRDRKYGPRH